MLTWPHQKHRLASHRTDRAGYLYGRLPARGFALRKRIESAAEDPEQAQRCRNKLNHYVRNRWRAFPRPRVLVALRPQGWRSAAGPLALAVLTYRTPGWSIQF